MCLCQKVKEAVVFGQIPAVPVQISLRVLFLKFGQGRPCFLLFGDEGILKAQPEQALVFSCLLFRFQAAKQFLQLLVIVVFARKAEDTVPIDIRIAFFSIELEVRRKRVVRRRIPDQIICPFFLQVGYFLHHHRPPHSDVLLVI